MALTLSVRDNADGSGITATLAGSDAGSTNTVYAHPAGASQGSWSYSAARTGDGTVTLALPAGYFWAYAAASAVSAAPAVSAVAGLFVVTTGLTAVEERILDAVVAGVQAMCSAGSLPGLPATQVYKRLALPEQDPSAAYPCVFVTPNDRETQVGTLTGRDDWGKPAVVMICDRNSQQYTGNLPEYLLWRERIHRYFISQRLQGVSEVMTCTVEAGPIIDPKLPMYEFLVSAFTLRFRTREVRGV